MVVRIQAKHGSERVALANCNRALMLPADLTQVCGCVAVHHRACLTGWGSIASKERELPTLSTMMQTSCEPVARIANSGPHRGPWPAASS